MTIASWTTKMFNAKDRLITIEIYSHFFRLINISSQMILTINEFIKPLVQFEMNRALNRSNIFTPNKIFASRTVPLKEFRFHINQLADFLDLLKMKYVPEDSIEIIEIPMYVPEKLNFKYRIDKEPRDYQQKVINHIISPIENHKIRLVGLPTGTGKTFCGLFAATKIKTRVMIIILPTYIPKWVEDIQENLHVDKKSIIAVQGSGHLKGLIDMTRDNTLDADYIIVSVRTLQNFIEKYELDPDICVDEYGCRPDDLYRLTKTGQVIIDETHQHIHAIFKITLFMHVPHLTALSATLISDDALIKKVHTIMYPKITRYDELLMDKYIKIFPIDYSFNDFKNRRIRTNEFGSNTYSHNAYEKSIMRDPRNLKSYLTMISDITELSYIRMYEEENKLVIFVSTTAMCALLVAHLRKIYDSLVINKYTQEDLYSNLMDSDIIVTTIQSAGTAVDIPNLTNVIMTVSVSSVVANIQVLGRLRKLQNKDVRFAYLYCTNLPKHIETHRKRLDIFKDRAVSIKNMGYNKLL